MPAGVHSKSKGYEAQYETTSKFGARIRGSTPKMMPRPIQDRSISAPPPKPTTPACPVRPMSAPPTRPPSTPCKGFTAPPPGHPSWQEPDKLTGTAESFPGMSSGTSSSTGPTYVTRVNRWNRDVNPGNRDVNPGMSSGSASSSCPFRQSSSRGPGIRKVDVFDGPYMGRLPSRRS